jgi:biopolymer transport protein ExbB/TolQ
MKNVHLLWIVFLAVAITVATAHGQGQPDRGERVEALKISFITEQLSLTPDEAKVFWPVFNQFEEERKAIRQMHAAGGKKLEFMSDEEAEAMINKEIEFQQKNLEITRKYVGEFKKILPVKKVAVLLTLEKRFSKLLLDRVKQGGGPPPGGR